MAQNPNVTDSIVRQSQLKLAIDFLKQSGIEFTMLEVVGITNILVDYCQQGYSTEIKEKINAVDKHVKSKKKKNEELKNLEIREGQ